jgi:hypothetical protein
LIVGEEGIKSHRIFSGRINEGLAAERQRVSDGESPGAFPKPEESLPVDLGRKKWNFGVGSALFNRHVCVSVELNELFVLQEKKT